MLHANSAVNMAHGATLPRKAPPNSRVYLPRQSSPGGIKYAQDDLRDQPP